MRIFYIADLQMFQYFTTRRRSQESTLCLLPWVPLAGYMVVYI